MPDTLINSLHPSVADRMDPQFAEIYTKYQAPRLRADQVTYEEYNSNRSKYTFQICNGPFPEVGSAKTYKVLVTNPAGEIDVRVYTPTADAIAKGGLGTKDGKLPAHVDYHGGGFVIGNLGSDDSWCRQACQAVGCTVVNVDYRLSPEFPTRFLSQTLGEPYYGSLKTLRHWIAAVLALKARDEPQLPNLVLQMLIVPAVDARFIPLEGSCSADVPYKSYIENEFAPCLPLQRLRWFYNLWLGTDVEARKKKTENFLASPILATSHANLAPASIHVAEIDSLTSEGIAYHEKLTEAGTPSNLKVYKGVGHPFGHWDGELQAAKDFVQDTIAALKTAYKL